jgi:hypothetical protein
VYIFKVKASVAAAAGTEPPAPISSAGASIERTRRESRPPVRAGDVARGSSSVKRDDITVRVPAAWELPGFETRLHNSLINSNGAAARASRPLGGFCPMLASGF